MVYFHVNLLPRKQHITVVENIHLLPYSLKLSAKFMKLRSCWLIFTLIGLSLTSCSQPKSSQEIAETVKNSIVLISYQNEAGSGTGFIVQGSTGVCTMITARHVVEGRSLNLQTNDKKYWKTDSIQTSPNFDLAVVTFKSSGQNCPYPSLKLGDSDSVKEGDKIYISGFPNDRADSGKLGRQFVGGFVSAFEVLEKGYGLSYDAKVENGMSGGPVLDVNGKVVAVHGLFYKGFPWGIPIKTYQANQSWESQPLAKADYTKLQQLLAAEQWKEANRETGNKMLEVAGRQKEGWLDTESVANFSCPDLRAMDRLWVKYSDGRFGFSVQKQIYQSLGGTKEYNPQIWVAFNEKIGWKQKGEKGEWLQYSQLTFNTQAPWGHQPTTVTGRLGWGGGSWGVVWFGAIFFSRVETCKV